jgi:hypothetical protein
VGSTQNVERTNFKSSSVAIKKSKSWMTKKMVHILIGLINGVKKKQKEKAMYFSLAGTLAGYPASYFM